MMTKDEALRGLTIGDCRTRREAVKTVKELLNREECEDAVSRQAAIEAFQMFREYESNRSNKEWVDRIETVLNQLPPVTSQPKTGRWIYGEDNSGTGRDGWYCNQCGHFEFWDYSSDMKSAELNLPNLCPNCKAKMQEVEE